MIGRFVDVTASLDTVTVFCDGSVVARHGRSWHARAMGHLAIRAGAEVRFHKNSRILADLAGGHADRTFDKRLAAHVKADLLILDDFAMREFTPGQADDFYELICQRIAEGRSIAITASRAPQDWYRCSPTPSSPNHSWTV
jgi:DNA replication protein DnaC